MTLVVIKYKSYDDYIRRLEAIALYVWEPARVLQYIKVNQYE
jgi:hypothetical protein